MDFCLNNANFLKSSRLRPGETSPTNIIFSTSEGGEERLQKKVSNVSKEERHKNSSTLTGGRRGLRGGKLGISHALVTSDSRKRGSITRKKSQINPGPSRQRLRRVRKWGS